MKRKVVIYFIIFVFLFSTLGIYSCGDTKVINKIEYDTYGFLNKEDNYNPNIHYKLIVENIVWEIILSETIIAPIYFFEFSLYEPVEKK